MASMARADRTDGDGSVAEIELRELPEMQLAALPHRGAYHLIGATFEKLAEALSAAGCWSETRGFVGAYHDDPSRVSESDLRSHAGAVWAGDMAPPEGLEVLSLPPGRYAVLTYSGPYDGLAAAWRKLEPDALTALDVSPRHGPALEIYLDDPRALPPERPRIDLCIPVT
jgi:AraC family transcriptional regulator